MALEQKDKELADCKALFEQLKKDFKYNLKLLQDRDLELEQSDVSVTQLRSEITRHMSTISELGVRCKNADDSIQVLMREKELAETNMRKQLERERADHSAAMRECHLRYAQEIEELRNKCHLVEQQLKVRANFGNHAVTMHLPTCKSSNPLCIPGRYFCNQTC